MAYLYAWLTVAVMYAIRSGMIRWQLAGMRECDDHRAIAAQVAAVRQTGAVLESVGLGVILTAGLLVEAAGAASGWWFAAAGIAWFLGVLRWERHREATIHDEHERMGR